MASLDELLGTVARLVTDGITPACQVAVARDGELLATETFGAPPATRFAAYSATKPIVASAVWLLIGTGRLDPARPVADLVPELAAAMPTVTLEQVMLHTSGFPNAPMTAVEGADPERRRARFAEWTLEWEPGSRFEYHASSAHWVLADLIERVTRTDFRDVVEREVCAPLGLPRLLGIRPDEQDGIAPGVATGDPAAAPVPIDPTALDRADVRAAGVPGGGGIMTAADLARFYQGVLVDRIGRWDAAVLADATTNVRCVLPDPLMGVPANRTLGLVLAGDDGLHQMRYAMFGAGCSPGSFGHAGAFGQVGWADPATGTSFAFLKNGLNADMVGDAVHLLPIVDLAAALD
ncbi:MAG: serine hydrolase domain-containing protein [Actinomycetota bacterium]